VEKALKNKNHFSTLLPRGSENMSGLPQFHRLYYKFIYILKKKNRGFIDHSVA
jgi:hypothetical protein